MTLKELLAAAVTTSLDWIAPRACAACDGALGRERVFCTACGGPPPPVAATVAELLVCAAGAYDPPLAPAISRLKYGARTDLAPQLAELLVQAMLGNRTPLELHDAVLVPVPLHPLKLAERGFNQSALVGRVVARRLKLPFAPRALARRCHTAAQASLNKAERLTQLRGAFTVAQPERVAGRSVLLLDDVITTGATIDACADALREAGALPALALALARTDDARAQSTALIAVKNSPGSTKSV